MFSVEFAQNSTAQTYNVNKHLTDLQLITEMSVSGGACVAGGGGKYCRVQCVTLTNLSVA